MNIIFGEEQASKLAEKFTVLELDTFKLGINGPEITAFCVVEQIPISEFPISDQLKIMHSNLLENYRQRQWNYCEQMIKKLRGSWGEELDTFYDEVQRRISEFKMQAPASDWTPVILKSID